MRRAMMTRWTTRTNAVPGSLRTASPTSRCGIFPTTAARTRELAHPGGPRASRGGRCPVGMARPRDEPATRLLREPRSCRHDAAPSDVAPDRCEWKGVATYADLVDDAGRTLVTDAAWTYPEPGPAYAELAGHWAFYPQRIDECRVDDEHVRAERGRLLRGVDHGQRHRPVQGRSRHAQLVSEVRIACPAFGDTR